MTDRPALHESVFASLEEAIDVFTEQVRNILLDAARQATGALAPPAPDALESPPDRLINTARAKALGVGTHTFARIVRERVAAGDPRFAMPRPRVFLATPEGLRDALAAVQNSEAPTPGPVTER